MELYEEILHEVLKKEHDIVLTKLKASATKVVEKESYIALKKIKSIIEDESLEDKECFLKIEEIIRLFEKMGSDGGFRHDF